MTLRLFIVAALLSGLTKWVQAQAGATPSASPLPSAAQALQSPPPLPANSLAPYEQRRANAKSVKVMTSILGISLGSRLEHAHEVLDKLCDAAHRPKEEKEDGEGEGERKVLWELSKSPYAFVFVKADDKEKVTYVSGFLRKGKELPFEKIGETKKAPVQDQNTIAWDVLRAKQAPFRVVASGLNRKANNIMIFVVKRPSVFKNG